MRAVVQRVLSAKVTTPTADGIFETISEIGDGLVLFVGVRTDDTIADAEYLAQKVASLRIFEDDGERLNLSVLDTGGAVIAVSNFTLYADARKGRRPSFTDAASGEAAEPLYIAFGQAIAAVGIPVKYGKFGAEMHVELVNNGPVTLLLDSRKQF